MLGDYKANEIYFNLYLLEALNKVTLKSIPEKKISSKEEIQLPLFLVRYKSQYMLVTKPKSKKMRPATKLQVSNIVMTPSSMLRVLQHLEDYYHKNVTRIPKDDEEWPGPNLFYKDTFNLKLHAVSADRHRLPDLLEGVKKPN